MQWSVKIYGKCDSSSRCASCIQMLYNQTINRDDPILTDSFNTHWPAFKESLRSLPLLQILSRKCSNVIKSTISPKARIYLLPKPLLSQTGQMSFANTFIPRISMVNLFLRHSFRDLQSSDFHHLDAYIHHRLHPFTNHSLLFVCARVC